MQHSDCIVCLIIPGYDVHVGIQAGGLACGLVFQEACTPVTRLYGYALSQAISMHHGIDSQLDLI